MSDQSDTSSMAVFCDFENIALGVRDANYAKFDIHRVLERLLLKGSIVVKKAYCDWQRYKEFKGVMHEAAFELIDIPHVRQSGKNSADIRMVVDALDLCYTKAHVDSFVIVSGDSDFSPLVSKLRENAKEVIGVGVKNSSSDLLIGNCDEFIFYDDLVREGERKRKRSSGRRSKKKVPKGEAKKEGGESNGEDTGAAEDKVQEALDMVIETVEELLANSKGEDPIWGSMVKQTIKRRRPGFNESYYGFRSFGKLIEEAGARKLIEVSLDERSGGHVIKAVTADD